MTPARYLPSRSVSQMADASRTQNASQSSDSTTSTSSSTWQSAARMRTIHVQLVRAFGPDMGKNRWPLTSCTCTIGGSGRGKHASSMRKCTLSTSLFATSERAAASMSP